MILDTNGLSAWVEGEPELEPFRHKADQIAIPVIVLGEYRYGISHSRNRKYYEQWIADSLPKFRVLSVDEQTAVCYSTIRSELKKAGKPIPANDLWIAALCRQHSLPLLSRDRHFDFVAGIKRLQW
ncbi:MAG: type II toxin-antitoxin system VapC family toxin [Acidobacteriaceae bacterium]|nr:type II toxin-antitoxin system VapC family toxin [Acidobacteriaceae bacterium]